MGARAATIAPELRKPKRRLRHVERREQDAFERDLQLDPFRDRMRLEPRVGGLGQV